MKNPTYIEIERALFGLQKLNETSGLSFSFSLKIAKLHKALFEFFEPFQRVVESERKKRLPDLKEFQGLKDEELSPEQKKKRDFVINEINTIVNEHYDQKVEGFEIDVSILFSEEELKELEEKGLEVNWGEITPNIMLLIN